MEGESFFFSPLKEVNERKRLQEDFQLAAFNREYQEDTKDYHNKYSLPKPPLTMHTV